MLQSPSEDSILGSIQLGIMSDDDQRLVAKAPICVDVILKRGGGVFVGSVPYLR